MSKNFMVVSRTYGDHLLFEMTPENVAAFNRLFNSDNIYQSTWHNNDRVFYQKETMSVDVSVLSEKEIITRITNGTAYLQEEKTKQETSS